METFSQMSQFAQSWGIAGMAVFFVLAVAWAFRPGSAKVYDAAATAIFRNDQNPATDGPAQVTRAGARRP
jgi:cytochrome c oxidase cbb3-type subunit IV